MMKRLLIGCSRRSDNSPPNNRTAFNAHATYKVDLNSATVTADKVTSNGVTVTSGALVSIGDLSTFAARKILSERERQQQQPTTEKEN